MLGRPMRIAPLPVAEAPDPCLRREPRIRLPADVAQRLRVECLGLEGGTGRLVDVSRCGLRMVAAGEFRLDDRLRLALPRGDGATTVVEAVVRWWRPWGEGLGEGGLRIDPDSLRGWHEVLQAHVVPWVEAAAALVPPAPAPDVPCIALVGPDVEATARLAARLGSAGLPARLVTPAAGGPTPVAADIVIAGPYRSEPDAREALAALLRTPGLPSPLPLILLSGADSTACRALLEAGAFDCLSERDGGEALDLRLVVALRLCQQRQQARVAADRLMDLSGRDPLTGLANRRQFLALAADERRRAKRMREPLALLLLDVDHFKQVNDLYGHPAGDATLRALARLLRRHLRPFDVVGRYGGEEFLVLLSGATQQGGLTAAERLRALIAATPFDVQGIIRLTASVGVVSSEPPHTVPFAQLLASADRALYRAKHSGRNQVKPGVLTMAPARPPEDAARGTTILSFGDVTERKRAREALRQSEEQLRQSQKMEAVGRLAGGVAHDFNNLLTAITGYSQLALNGLGDRDPVRKDIEEIRKAADRAASLTHQLLAFSRRQVLEPKVLDLNAVVADMETMLRRLIGEDIDLISILDPAAGQVTADPGQLEQVLLNLAVNARDAMPQGGKLVIETANAELDEAYAARHVAVRPGPYVMLAVSDTGHGMDAETRARVFEPFFTTKEPGKGTGLGLSTVYGIVKQSGGNVWVYSEPEHGTTFKIYLPRVEDAAETPVPHAQPLTPAGGAETILLVEDDGGVRSLARRVLESQGYRVLEARQGDEALAVSAWYEGPIALMLTDLVMPGKGGRELARCFASVRPDMRVLYMSGYTDKAIFQQQVFDPGTAFLSKPFTPDELARKVREVLDTARSG